MKKIIESEKASKSIEKLVYFRCNNCNKWWTIGDAPIKRKKWWCPWCGKIISI